MADNNPSTNNQSDEQLEQSPPLPPQQLVVPRRYLEWAYKAACSIETIAKVLNEMTTAKDCQDELSQRWSHRHDGDLLPAIEALAEGIQLRMEEPLDPAFQKEALTDRLARIESMAAARVGENEGENA
jgi:hypothetical protein